MNYFFKKFFIFLYLSLPLFANQNFIDKALSLKLDKNRYWLELLHFENGSSTINNQKFFLSSHGKIDPRSELIETLKDFQKDKSTICKYPARYKWLNGKLKFNIKKPQCKALSKFLKPNYKAISVIFTAERYNSSASLFGHTFLKLDTDTIPYAINYAAQVPDKENRFIYAYKGLSGKYLSHYKLLPYAIKDYEYRSKEFRDLIAFKIDFNADEIENIMLHLYEIKDTNQNYYFISRNCSSELLKLLNIANEKLNLTKDLKTTAIPIDIVYILQKHHLVDKISIKFSKLKQFYHVVNKLNRREKDILLKIIKHKISVNSLDKNNFLSKDAKSLIIVAAMKYLEIVSTQGKFTTRNTSTLLNLIQLQSKYREKEKFNNIKIFKNNPVSNKFHKFTVGIKYNSENLKQTDFGYRYLYRSRFDLVDLMRKNGSIELFDLNLRSIKNKISLDNFTLINLEAMPLSNIFFKETTNKIKAGMKRLFYSDTLYTYFDYGMGYRYILNNNFDDNLLVKAGVYYHHKDIYLFSVENSLEYYYKNLFINEIKCEINSYSNGIRAYNMYINNYLKISKSTTLNISLAYKKDKKEYSYIAVKYNYLF